MRGCTAVLLLAQPICRKEVIVLWIWVVDIVGLIYFWMIFFDQVLVVATGAVTCGTLFLEANGVSDVT